MSNFVSVAKVRNKKTNKKYELFLDKKTMNFILRDKKTNNIKQATEKETEQFKRKYYLKYNQINFLNNLKKTIKMYLKLLMILYLLDFVLANKKIISSIPRLVRNYLYDNPKEELILEDVSYFIGKNDALSEQEKTYLENVLREYMHDGFVDNDFLTTVKTFAQLSTLDLIFLTPEDGYRKHYNILGEFRELPIFNDQVIIYKDSYSTGLHEMIHAIYPISRQYGYGVSLYEGYAGSVEANYTGVMSYSIQNEYLCIISQIIGTNKLIELLNKANYIGITNEIAIKSHVSYFEVKELIDNMDLQLSNARNGIVDQQLQDDINSKLYELCINALGENAKDNFYIRNIGNLNYQLVSPFFLPVKCYEIMELSEEIINDERIKVNPSIIMLSDYNKTKDDLALMLETIYNSNYQLYSKILENYGTYDANLLSYLIIHNPRIQDIDFYEDTNILVYENNGLYYHFYPALRGSTGEIRYCYKESSLEPYQPYIEQRPICNFNFGGITIPVIMMEISKEDNSKNYLDATLTINYLNYSNNVNNTLEPLLILNNNK